MRQKALRMSFNWLQGSLVALCLLLSSTMFAQVTGTIVDDANDEPLIGASLLMLIALGATFVIGLYEVSELRETYLARLEMPLYKIGSFHLYIRYIGTGLIGLSLFILYKLVNKSFDNPVYHKVYEVILATAIVWYLSSELLHWMDIYGTSNSYKLALSILWGVFSLLTISFGIWKRKVHLRWAAISLFAITLVKLFMYDISHLNTISKTIVYFFKYYYTIFSYYL